MNVLFPHGRISASGVAVASVVIRREFRINGQIGELGQKDKLSYTNLMHQIDTGKRKGHGDAEIVEL